MSLFLLPKPGTDAEFLVVFNRLAVALREAQDDTGLTQSVYFEALKDVPLPALEAGALTLMREPGRKWFPTSAEWRTAAEQALTGQIQAAMAAAITEPERATLHCRECMDTGWVFDRGNPMACPGDETCGRHRTHASHTYTRACPCRATNPAYQRTKHFGAGR